MQQGGRVSQRDFKYDLISASGAGDGASTSLC